MPHAALAAFFRQQQEGTADAYLANFALVLGLVLPGVVFAGGGDGAPEPMQTSTGCKKSEVWDEKTAKCIDAQSGRFDNDTLYDAARELAYAAAPTKRWSSRRR